MRKAFSLVEVIVVILICIVLAGFVFPHLLKKKIAMNDALAQRTLSLLSIAAEKYAIDHHNQYPVSMEELRQTQTDYLKQDFCGKVRAGFVYHCDFSAQGYIFKAKPSHPSWSGTKDFSVMTGGVVAK